MGEWIKRREGWLGQSNRREKIIHITEQPTEGKEEEKNQSTPYGVVYFPIICPNCGSKNTKCYASRAPTRYHKCKKCKYRFKSREASENEISTKKVVTTL